MDIDNKYVCEEVSKDYRQVEENPRRKDSGKITIGLLVPAAGIYAYEKIPPNKMHDMNRKRKRWVSDILAMHFDGKGSCSLVTFGAIMAKFRAKPDDC